MALTFFAFETVSVGGSAIGFTVATYATANQARVFVESAAIRFRLDGTDPTASVGEPVEMGTVITLDSPDQIQKFKAISQFGGTASLSCHYGRI
jgi:hypothetical protein